MADAMSDTAQTWGTSCCGGRYSMVPGDWKTLVYSALAIVLLSQLAPVVFGRVIGGSLGWYLRRVSSGRRAHLVGLMRLDQERCRSERVGLERRRGNDEDKAEGQAAEPASDKPGADWGGVVGFFHPFWYVLSHTVVITLGIN